MVKILKDVRRIALFRSDLYLRLGMKIGVEKVVKVLKDVDGVKGSKTSCLGEKEREN